MDKKIDACNQLQPVSNPNTCLKSHKSKAIVTSLLLLFLISYYDELKSPFVSSIKQSEKPKAIHTLNSDAKSKPEIAWIMSFPNSGTSFTSALVRELTETSTGTNYDEAKHPTPIFPDEYQYGPFRLRQHLPLPDKGYILTKTHCTRCRGLQKSINKTTDEFMEGCQTVKKDNKCHGYDPKIVKRAVHLFRNPFDNVVGRFHLEWKSKNKVGNTKYVKKYPYSKEGFKKWCVSSSIFLFLKKLSNLILMKIM